MMHWLTGPLCGALMFMIAAPGFGHAKFKPGAINLALRNTNAGNKEASKPCGPGTRNLVPTWLKPGAIVTVEWEETIQHPGSFIFSYSLTGDTNFIVLTTVADTQDTPTVPHNYSVQLTMPNVTAPGLTLQLIQVMTENPAAPTNYYSCADVYLSAVNPSLSPSASPSPSSSVSPSPTPSVSPSPSPAPSPTPSAAAQAAPAAASGTTSTTKNTKDTAKKPAPIPTMSLPPMPDCPE